MKYLLYSIITLALLIDPNKVGKINTLKSEAKKAFMSGDYKTAIQKYSFLLDSLHVNEDELRLNLASAYYMSKDTANAVSNYQAVSGSEKNNIRSKAEQQLGVMADKNNKLEEALNHFKQAVKADPGNEDARYNYELVKKRLEEQKKKEEQKNKDNKDQKDQKKDDKNKDDKKKDDQKKDDKNKEDQKKDDEKKDDKNKDQKDKEKENKEQEKKEQEQKEQEQKDKEEKDKKNQPPPPSKYDQSKAPQLSEAQAKKILEAMKAQEKQYLQQNRRKSTKARDKNKPDW